MNKFIISIVVAQALAWHIAIPDPFKHSDCDCTRFCNYECAINPVEPHNLTVYRMTMKDVLGLSNKNTGDVAGDMSFVLSRRN